MTRHQIEKEFRMVMPHPKGDFDMDRANWRRPPGEHDGPPVEVAFVDDDLEWRKADTGGDAAVFVAFHNNHIYMRKGQQGAVLEFTIGEWEAFVDGAKAEEFDFD